MENITPVDYEKWPRKEIFEFFSGTDFPFYSVTFNLDITNLYAYVKAKELPFYHALTYLVSNAVNSIDAFSYCISDGQVCKLPPRWPSFTDLNKETGLFKIVTLPLSDNISTYCADAADESTKQSSFITPTGSRNNLVFISCLPWIEVTSVTNEHALDKDDAFPRITWGKFYEREGRKILGISVEVNHRFIDGVHIGMFGNRLQKDINDLII